MDITRHLGKIRQFGMFFVGDEMSFICYYIFPPPPGNDFAQSSCLAEWGAGARPPQLQPGGAALSGF